MKMWKYKRSTTFWMESFGRQCESTHLGIRTIILHKESEKFLKTKTRHCTATKSYVPTHHTPTPLPTPWGTLIDSTINSFEVFLKYTSGITSKPRGDFFCVVLIRKSTMSVKRLFCHEAIIRFNILFGLGQFSHCK